MTRAGPRFQDKLHTGRGIEKTHCFGSGAQPGPVTRALGLQQMSAPPPALPVSSLARERNSSRTTSHKINQDWELQALFPQFYSLHFQMSLTKLPDFSAYYLELIYLHFPAEQGGNVYASF